MNLEQIVTKSGYYKVKALPGQSDVGIKEVLADGTIKISLTESAQKGRANKQLIQFLAESLHIRKENVKIASGLASRIKIVSIDLDN